jgi:hypothetical protein
MSRVKQGSDKPRGDAAQKEKAGESSRSPNAVFYKSKYITNHTDCQGQFSGNFRWPGRTRPALAVDSGEPEWSAYSGPLDQFLKSTSAKAEEDLPNPKLFQ